jgi:hypothetical protein
MAIKKNLQAINKSLEHRNYLFSFYINDFRSSSSELNRMEFEKLNQYIDEIINH